MMPYGQERKCSLIIYLWSTSMSGTAPSTKEEIIYTKVQAFLETGNRQVLAVD
jgi:hypothetical protein